MDTLLIAVAPSIPPYMRSDLPPWDLSPEGVADEVVRAWNAGASLAHLAGCRDGNEYGGARPSGL